jgi:hypothetical protein
MAGDSTRLCVVFSLHQMRYDTLQLNITSLGQATSLQRVRTSQWMVLPPNCHLPKTFTVSGVLIMLMLYCLVRM